MDLIRGVAICGLVPINILDFASSTDWFFMPTNLDGIDRPLWSALSVFGFSKFVSLFSLLFGAGIWLQTSRIESQGLPVARTYLPRLGWLWVFGLLHAYLVWYGDILVIYALVGALAYCCRRWSAKVLAWVGGAIQMSFLLFFAALISLIFLLGGGEQTAEALASYQDSEKGTFWDMEAAFAGSWLDQMPLRSTMVLLSHFFILPFFYLPGVGSLFLVGMALVKSGFFQGQWAPSRYRATLLISASVGIALSAIGVWLTYRDGWVNTSLLKNSVWLFPATPCLTLAYATAMILWSQSSILNRLKGWLTSVGKMAFTNYISQTILFSLLFYGSGLGWRDQLSFHQVLMICPAIWLLQIVVSTLWLKHFHRGPLESLWRRLAYRNR